MCLHFKSWGNLSMHFHYMAFTKMTFFAACILTAIFFQPPRNNVKTQSIINVIYSKVIFRFKTRLIHFTRIYCICCLCVCACVHETSVSVYLLNWVIGCLITLELAFEKEDNVNCVIGPFQNHSWASLTHPCDPSLQNMESTSNATRMFKHRAVDIFSSLCVMV